MRRPNGSALQPTGFVKFAFDRLTGAVKMQELDWPRAGQVVTLRER